MSDDGADEEDLTPPEYGLVGEPNLPTNIGFWVFYMAYVFLFSCTIVMIVDCLLARLAFIVLYIYGCDVSFIIAVHV